MVDMVAAGIHSLICSIADGRHYGSTGTWPLIPGVDGVARTAEGALIYTGFVRPLRNFGRTSFRSRHDAASSPRGRGARAGGRRDEPGHVLVAAASPAP